MRIGLKKVNPKTNEDKKNSKKIFSVRKQRAYLDVTFAQTVYRNGSVQLNWNLAGNIERKITKNDLFNFSKKNLGFFPIFQSNLIFLGRSSQ